MTERRIYPDGGSGSGYESRITYSRPETLSGNLGYVITETRNASGGMLAKSQHYFHGSPKASFSQQPTHYGTWKDGREYKTEIIDTNSATVLRRVEHSFAQRASVSWWGYVWQDGYWSTATSGFPAWLEVQFNGSKTISEIDVVTLQDNYNFPVEPTDTMTFSSAGLSGYDVQYWNNGVLVTISGGSVSGNNKVWRKFTFSPLTTSKIRVLSNASPDGYSRLTEVEAWTGP